MADATGLRRSVLRHGQRIAVNTAAEMERELRKAAAKHRKTGELDESIRVRAVGAGPRYRLHAEAPVIQAATTNTGARPHVIRPRNPGGLLVFHWPKVGRTVALRSVNHPGNRGSHWWDRTMKSATVQKAMRAASRRAA